MVKQLEEYTAATSFKGKPPTSKFEGTVQVNGWIRHSNGVLEHRLPLEKHKEGNEMVS